MHITFEFPLVWNFIILQDLRSEVNLEDFIFLIIEKSVSNHLMTFETKRISDNPLTLSSVVGCDLYMIMRTLTFGVKQICLNFDCSSPKKECIRQTMQNEGIWKFSVNKEEI